MTNINFSTFDTSIRGGPGLPDEQSGGEKEGQFNALLSALSVFPDTSAKPFEPPAQSEDVQTVNSGISDSSGNEPAPADIETAAEALKTGIDPSHGGPTDIDPTEIIPAKMVPADTDSPGVTVFNDPKVIKTAALTADDFDVNTPKPASETDVHAEKPISPLTSKDTPDPLPGILAAAKTIAAVEKPVTGKDVAPMTGKAIGAEPANDVLPETEKIVMPEDSDISIGSQDPTDESKPELAEMIGPPVQKPKAMFAATGKVPDFVVNNLSKVEMPVDTDPIPANPHMRFNRDSNLVLPGNEPPVFAPPNGKFDSGVSAAILPRGGMTVSIPAPVNVPVESGGNSIPHVDAASVAPDGPEIELPVETKSARENPTPILTAAQNLFASGSPFRSKEAGAFNEIRGRQIGSPHFSRKFVQYADMPGQKTDPGPVLTPPIVMFPGKTGVMEPQLAKGMKQPMPVTLSQAVLTPAETAVDAQEPVHEFHGEIDVPFFISPGNEAISSEDKLIKGPDLPFEKLSLSKERQFDSGRISDVIIGKFVLNADKSIKNFGGDLHAGINPFAGKLEKSILEVVEVMKENGKPSLLTLKLKPAELGEIEIRIEKFVGGHLKIEFHTENDQVKNILQQSFDQLRESMKDSGYQADKIDVFSRTSTENSNSQHPRDGNQRNNLSNAFNQTKSDELTDDSLFEPASKPNPAERLVSLRA